MSRVGREPIKIPAGVDVAIQGEVVKVTGKLGELQTVIPHGITGKIEGKVLTFTRADDSRQNRAFHGLARALSANMVIGVSEGFTKSLEIVGVGYRCEQKGNAIMLMVGYSHKIAFIPPQGVKINVKDATHFEISGTDKQVVGEIAAKIRSVRPPEPYKGKGIRYVDEHVRRKAGKAAGR